MDGSRTTFQAHHDDHKSALEQLNEILKWKETKVIECCLERRKSSKQTSEDVGKQKRLKLKPKGVPTLSVVKSGGRIKKIHDK